MLIQKTFHLHALQEVAKARLTDLAGYRRQFADVEVAVMTPEGKVHFVFRLPWGFRADVELTQLPGENPAQLDGSCPDARLHHCFAALPAHRPVG